MKFGIYPDILKVAKVTPVFKSGSKTNCSNFRPIAVLPGINKLFEKSLECRLRHFLNSQDFFYKNQYGFRAESDTKTATSDLINNILLSIDKKNIVSGLFLDLAKAFDTVNREILLKKLQMAGIRGRFLNIFQNYLDNRKQFVSINGSFSNTLSIQIGVPQGSVLGPLFFVVYINDFGNLNLKGDLRLYADDSAIFYRNKRIETNMNDIENDLELINEYFSINKLTLNISKSNFINFASRNKRFISPSEIDFNGQKIVRVDKVKYLGLIIDSSLKWKEHIDYICLKVSPMIGIISKLRYSLPRAILLNLYFSFIHSHFQYLNLIWASNYKINIQPLQILQNRVLKYIFFKDFCHNRLDLYKNVVKSILPIHSIFKFQSCNFVFQVLNNLCFNNLEFKYVDHGYDTRSDLKLILPSIRTNFGKFSLAYSGPNIYNNIPDYIKMFEKYSIFNKHLKLFYLSSDELLESLY